MKSLILFSAWANGLDANSDADWLKWYRAVLEESFAKDDKIIIVNHPEANIINSWFSGIENTIEVANINQDLVVNSDASGFQLALSRAVDLIPAYDVVLFIHTKGISYHYSLFEKWRNQMSSAFFDRQTLEMHVGKETDALYLARGHAEPEIWRIRQASNMAAALKLPQRPFSLYATNTIYGVSSASLSGVLCRLPPAFLNQNLLQQGFDRYLFETLFPTLLTAAIEEIKIIGDIGFQERLNSQVSFDAFPGHCSSVLLNLFRTHRADSLDQEQQPTPYVFGQLI